MCGESARTRSHELVRRAARGRARGRPAAILSAYVDALLGLGRERRRSARTSSSRRAATSAARAKTAPASSSGPIGNALLRRDRARRRAPRPVSMIVTPVSASPAMIARSTGAAPRQRGRSDGWTLSQSALGEQLRRDEQAVRDDDDGRRAEVEPRLEPLGLQHGDPEPLGGDLGRRRGELASAPAGGASGRVRSTRSRVAREPLEDVGPERRGRGDGDPCQAHARRGRGCGRSRASASRRDSSSVRSMMSTPSRWSSSCWTTRAGEPSSSSCDRLALDVAPSIVTATRRSTGTSTAPSDRQPSSSISVVLAALRDRPG